eukprot:4464933-Amphidinium_carterae.2
MVPAIVCDGVQLLTRRCKKDSCTVFSSLWTSLEYSVRQTSLGQGRVGSRISWPGFGGPVLNPTLTKHNQGWRESGSLVLLITNPIGLISLLQQRVGWCHGGEFGILPERALLAAST